MLTPYDVGDAPVRCTRGCNCECAPTKTDMKPAEGLGPQRRVGPFASTARVAPPHRIDRPEQFSQQSISAWDVPSPAGWSAGSSPSSALAIVLMLRLGLPKITCYML